MKSITRALSFAALAMMTQNADASSFVTLLSTKGSDPALHSDSQRPVIKSTLSGGRYTFERCTESLQFNENNLAASSVISDCKPVGAKEGYSTIQIENRIQDIEKKINKERLYDTTAITAGLLAGAGVGALPALKSSQRLVGDVGLSGRLHRLSQRRNYDKDPKNSLVALVENQKNEFLYTALSIDDVYKNFKIKALLGSSLGALTGGSLMHHLFWGTDEDAVLAALKAATGGSDDLNTISIELDGVDIMEMSRELNILLAGIE